MPPKKKAAGKKPESPQPLPEVLNPDEKKVFIKIIQELENRINKYQGICDYLSVTNTKYENELNQQISEKKDITNYLKKNLQSKGFEIYQLNNKLTDLNEEKDKERQSFESQLRLLKQEFQETKDALSVENITLAGKIASLEEFKVQKEDILSKISRLENEIKENEVKRKEELYQLEKQNILDRHTLQKVTLHKLIDISTKFREETNRQMAETTIRSIQENTALSNDYKKLKNKCAGILEENKKLKERAAIQKVNEEISQAVKKNLSTKNISLIGIIKILMETNKCLKSKLKSQQFKQPMDETPNIQESEDNELNNSKLNNDTNDSQLLELTISESQNNELLQRNYSVFQRILKFLIKIYYFLNSEFDNLENRKIEEEELSYELISMTSLITSLGVHDSEQEEIYKKLQSVPHQEEFEEEQEFKFSAPEEKYFHYRIGDAGIVPMESDVFLANIKKKRSRLIGDNKTYMKYLIKKISDKIETSVNEEISSNIVED